MGHRLLPAKPHLYHGKQISRPYFEGWYFKQASQTHAFCVIPGVFRGKTPRDNIAFIQGMIDNRESFFVTYPFKAFRYNNEEFKVWIGSSFFSLEKMILDIARDNVRLEAELTFSSMTKLTTHVLSPSIMGPFAYLPHMQCNHGVLSLTHQVNGTIRYRNAQTVLQNANGYIEKDWGEAFPKHWIWMQCNDQKTSLMCAIASIPYGPFHFTGLICVLLIHGRQYRFASYNMSYITCVRVKTNAVRVEIRRGRYRLSICASNKAFGKLKAPDKTGMNRYIDESISAEYDVALHKSGKRIFQRSYSHGGLEMCGAETILCGSGRYASR